MRHRPVLAVALVMLTISSGLPGAAAVPDAPVAVRVLPGEGRLIVAWDAPAIVHDKFRVYQVTAGGDVLVADLPTVWRRHVVTGLAEGETRTYRVAHVDDGVEASSAPVSGTTFSTTTTTSTFDASAEGFATEATGGGSVAWSSSERGILVRQPAGQTATDTVYSRALPETWGSETHDFAVETTVSRTQGGHDARFWALALAPAGSGDLATRPGVMGFLVDETSDSGGDGGHGVEFHFRSTNGSILAWDPTEFCYGCPLTGATYQLSISYDAQDRLLRWSARHVESGGFWSSEYRVGRTDGDFFSLARVAVATESPPSSGTAQHVVDDLVVTWSRADSRPTLPLAPTAQRAGAAGAVTFTWNAPLRAGTEPILGYRIAQDGEELGWEFDRRADLTGIPRWAHVGFSTLAVSEIGRGAAAMTDAAPEAGERIATESFDATPIGWAGRQDGWPGDSRVVVYESLSQLNLVYDTVGAARYGVDFDGAVWRPTTGSFSMEATYRDEGHGRLVGGCPLAILPASTNACTGPGVVAEFRAENRTAASPPTMRLRFVDAAGVTHVDVRHALAQTGTWRVNATYDHATHELAIRLKNATGILLAQGSTIVAPDAFALGFAGVSAGIGTTPGSSPADGLGFVEDVSLSFVAPQPAGLPGRPLLVTAQALEADGKALIEWSAPSGGPAIDAYRIYRTDRSGRVTLAGETAAASFEDSNLGRRQPYTYRVAAVGHAGEGLAAGREAITTLDVPGMPRGVNAARNGNPGELRVAWAPPLSSEYGATVDAYEVRRDGVLVATTDAATRAYVDTGLAEGAFHAYAVRAINGVGAGRDDTSGAFAPTKPSRPVNLRSIQGPAPGIANVTWHEPTFDSGLAITSYRLYRDGDLVQEGLARYLNESGLPEGATFKFEVSAVNALGEGPRVNHTFTVASRAAAPEDLVASPGPTRGNVTIAWAAPATTGGLGIARYHVYRTLGETTTLVGAITNLSNLSFRDGNLPHAANLTYQVAAVTGVGEGERAPVATRTWANVAPETVRSLNATRAGTGVVRVSWQAPLANDGPPTTAYRVYRIGGIQGETLAATVTGATQFLDSPLAWARQPALSYSYRVVAVNEAGEGASAWTQDVSPL